MLGSLTNLLYRRKDPTRVWVANASAITADLRLCTLCGVPVGGRVPSGSGLEALGPTENARRASRGFLEWYSQGVYGLLDQECLYDFTIAVRGFGRRIKDYRGNITLNGRPAPLRNMTAEGIEKLMGAPFARSTKGDLVLFYEYDIGEVQYAFDEDGQLSTVEFACEPELAVKRARQFYGVDKDPAAGMSERSDS